MVCLLRNLTKVTIQDHLPQPADISEGAAVSRIKYYRNQIAHSDSGTMSDADFNNTFDAVSKAIEIICPTMKSDCNILQNADLDNSFHEIYVEFARKEKHMEELSAQVETLNLERNNILSIQNEEISEWKKKLEKFYVTEAATRLIKVVRDNQCTIITGIPGSGKSALAYHVAIHMQETEGYTALPIWLPSEMIKMTNYNIKQLFVFDDVFGKYSLNEFNLNCWESESRRIKMLLKNQMLKVIVTCRSYLYDKVKDNISSLSFVQYDLQSDDINLSLVERKEISKLYLTDDVVGQLNDDIIMMYSFFPLLCVMFKENLMENVDFFQNPNHFIKNEIENFKSRKDVSFIALLLLVLSNNSIQKEGLQIGINKYDNILQDLCDEIDTTKCPSKTSILSNLQSLKNMYLKETDVAFSTKHDKIFDIISYTVGSFIIHCILRHGESSFISSRCQLISLNEKHDDCTIMIADELESMYFKRIMKDIEHGYNWEVFASIQMEFEKYRTVFIQYLEKSSVKFSSLRINDTTALHVTAAKGYFDMSKYLLEKNRKQLLSLNSTNRSPLHIASMNGHHKITILFLSKDAEIEQVDNEGCTPLLLSSMMGHLNVTEVLLKTHANVNRCTTKIGWSALHFAASDGNIDLIKLLVKHKAIVNSQKHNGMTALYLACNFGHFNAVKLLIESKADGNKCENEGWSPLHVACYEGFYDIAEILILNGADVNKDTNTEEIPLHYACERNHINVVNLLLHHGSRIDKGNGNEETPLHITCHKSDVDMLKLLCEFGASTNKRNKCDYTPLHCFCEREIKQTVERAIINATSDYERAIIKGMHLIHVVDRYTDMFKHLIKYGADVNAVSNHGMTPIIMVCKQNNVDAFKRLLYNEPDANKFDDKGWSLLHILPSKGNEAIVNILLKYGVSIDHYSEEGFSSLLLVYSCGEKYIADVLINGGVAINVDNETGNSSLLLACNDRQNEIAEVNSHDDLGRTALYCAAEKGNLDLIKILIEHEADVNFQRSNGMTPIYIACNNNQIEAVKMLLSYEADINICEKSGCNPLFIASYKNHTDVMAYLCDHSAADVNLSNKDGYSPLYLAFQEGNEDIVTILLKHNASINHCSVYGFSPFDLACSHGYKNIVELVIKAGATVNKVNESGNSPLLLACNNKQNEVALVLLENGAEVNENDEDGRTSLYSAAEDGNIDLIKILIEHGADVNFQTHNGMTPMYVACENNHIQSVKRLLRYKADINKCEKSGWSPLHIASYDNYKEIVAYLCDHGNADVNLCTKKGESPLDISCRKGHQDIVQLLLKHGASINYCDKKGFIPFHKACSKSNIRIVELLIKEDAAVNFTDRTGRTPLYIACQSICTEEVKLLLKHGAEVDKAAQDATGKYLTHLHVSSSAWNTDITKLLLKNNATENLDDRNGHTPLYYATQNNDYDASKLFVSYGPIFSDNDVQSNKPKSQKRCAIQ